jgi:type I restriction enzyme S subunit
MAIDLMPSSLGTLLFFGNGKTSPPRSKDGDYPVYGSNGVIGYAAESNADANTIVIGRVGSYCGSLYFSKQKCWVTDNAIRATARDDNDARFAYYLLSTLNLNNMRAGSGQPLLNQSILSAIDVRVPVPDEQRAISAVLGTLDDKIALNQRMSETLEGMAQGLFKSWFVDFDPVRAKVENRTTTLPHNVADLFPNSFAMEDTHEIPTGWHLRPIGELATVTGGSTPSTKEESYWEGGTHRWATPKDLSALETPVLLDTERKITDAGLAQIGSGLLPPGTVLMSSRAPIGYLAIAEIPIAINQGFIAMKAAEGVSNIFLLRWAEWAHDFIVSRANGSTFLEISKSSFRPILVTTPPDSLMNEFDRLARPLYSRMVANEISSRTLAQSRDALLPKLISGELRLPDAERIVGGQV